MLIKFYIIFEMGFVIELLDKLWITWS